MKAVRSLQVAAGLCKSSQRILGAPASLAWHLQMSSSWLQRPCQGSPLKGLTSACPPFCRHIPDAVDFELRLFAFCLN